jgi:hypothetical protein
MAQPVSNKQTLLSICFNFMCFKHVSNLGLTGHHVGIPAGLIGDDDKEGIASHLTAAAHATLFNESCVSLLITRCDLGTAMRMMD